MSIIILSENNRAEDPFCHICHANFKPDEKSFTHAKGEKHGSFHGDCLRNWMDRQISKKMSPTCPFDRIVLDTEFDPNSYLSKVEKIFRKSKKFLISAACAATLACVTEGAARLAETGASWESQDGLAGMITGSAVVAAVTFTGVVLARWTKTFAEKVEDHLETEIQELEGAHQEPTVVFKNMLPLEEINRTFLRARLDLLATKLLVVHRIVEVADEIAATCQILAAAGGMMGSAVVLGAGLGCETGAYKFIQHGQIAAFGLNAATGAFRKKGALLAAAVAGGSGMVQGAFQFVKEEPLRMIRVGRAGMGLVFSALESGLKKEGAALMIGAVVAKEAMTIVSEGLQSQLGRQAVGHAVAQWVAAAGGKVFLKHIGISRKTQVQIGVGLILAHVFIEGGLGLPATIAIVSLASGIFSGMFAALAR